MVGAEPAEVPQRGRPAFGDRDVVIDLQVPVDVAALDRTFGEHLLERRPELRRDSPAQMRHRTYVLAIDDQSLEDRIVAQTIRHGHRDGSDSGHLAHLPRLRMPAPESGVIHTNDDGATWLAVSLASRRAGERDQGVEGEGVGTFTAACVAGSPEEIALVRLQRRHDPRRGIGGPAHVDAARAVDVSPVAQRPCFVDRLVAGRLVRARGCPHPGTLILESPDAVAFGAVQEQALGAGIRPRGGHDLVDLHLRQLPAPERGLGLGKLLEARRGLDGGAGMTHGRTARRRQPCRGIAERSGVSPRPSLLDAAYGERLPRSGEALDPGELLDQPPCLRPVEA